MTLTEQWKKGELEQGWYYIECIDLPERWIDVDYYRNDCYEDEGFCKGFFDHNDWRGIDKVLAPVPSYEEWERVTKYANKCEVEYIECANDYEKLKEENQQLKELLSQTRNRQSLIREYLSDCKLGNAWDLLYQTENEITNAIGEKK